MRSLGNFRSRRLLLVLLLGAVLGAEPALQFHIAGDEPGPWPRILGSLGLGDGGEGQAEIVVLRSGVPARAATWLPRIEGGAIVILEGESEFASALGFRPGTERITVRQARDTENLSLPLIWSRDVALPVFHTPAEAKVFTRERWTNAPLAAGLRRGKGAVLWLAVSPGEAGYERFPYLPQALTALGLELPFSSRRLWAFFDSAYRLRADPEYLARRWRASGIAGLHVASWQVFEPDPDRDAYLHRLIAACHRNAILVYAWLELPHVSEAFWQAHPEWREKTALGDDAHLDWRKLMNLADPDCARAVKAGVSGLLDRFPWDGVNLAELYFESLEGITNPSRFTPFNATVRAEFTRQYGADPVAVVREAGHALQPALLAYRASLAQRLQEEWLEELHAKRTAKPHLDLVLTHVDDRFDTRMRDAIGAESERLLPLLGRFDFTFLVEDPATIWHLGPARYPQIAAKYPTPHQDRLAVDINIVERYQDVYPTKMQTGVELFQLIHNAAASFARVALYFENSICRADLPYLAAAAARVHRAARVSGRLVVSTPGGTGVHWSGPVKVNGRRWPVTDGQTLWLPPGEVAVEPDSSPLAMRVVDFNGDLLDAAVEAEAVVLSYQASHRAMAVLSRQPAEVLVDGQPFAAEWTEGASGPVLFLPKGQHIVTFVPASSGTP